MPDYTAGLEADGAALVSSIVEDMRRAKLEPDAREGALLRVAGELRDRMAQLEAAIKADGLRRELKSGAVQLHPAVAEIRQHKLTLSKCLAGIAMVDSTASALKSARHQRAASVRWSKEAANG